MFMRQTLRIAVVVLALAAALAPLPPAWIERVYSGALFPRLQAFVTSLSNLVPFALFDVLIALTVMWWVGAAAADRRRIRRERQGRVWRAVVLRTITLAAVGYLAFLGLWGL